MGIAVYLGIGSNLEERNQHLSNAVASLAATDGCEVLKVSPTVETRPVGGPPGQRPYLNAAIKVDTSLTPEELLDVLQAIEMEGGRVRKERWGSRTIDIDILFYGEQIIQTNRLQVPHPRMGLRMFVLLPLSKIAPEHIDPLSGQTILNLVANCKRRPSVVDLSGWTRFAPAAMATVETRLAADDWLVLDSDITKLELPTSPTLRIDWQPASGSATRPVRAWPPVLRIESEDAEVAISETLTACEATRSVPGYD